MHQTEFKIILDRISANDPTLKELNLSALKLDATQVKKLAEALKVNKTLTSLNLDFNQISAAGAKELAEALKVNETLTLLSLVLSPIGDTGAKDLAEALKTNKTLTSLKLWTNEIGDMGTKDLAEALKTNKTLTSLYLWNNKIGDMGTKDLAEALKTNETLTLLDLGGNNIGETGKESLVGALKTNYSLIQVNVTKHYQDNLKLWEDFSFYLKRNKIWTEHKTEIIAKVSMAAPHSTAVNSSTPPSFFKRLPIELTTSILALHYGLTILEMSTLVDKAIQITKPGDSSKNANLENKFSNLAFCS